MWNIGLIATISTCGIFSNVMSGIICCVCSISVISVCTMSKRLQKVSGEERVIAKSRPIMNLIANGAVARIIVDFSNARGREVMEIQILEYNCSSRILQVRDLQCDLISAETLLKASGHASLYPRSAVSNSEDEARHVFPGVRQATQSGMTTVFVSFLKSGKLILRFTSDRSDLMKLFGELDTRSSTWFLSRGNSSRRHRAIRYERGNSS